MAKTKEDVPFKKRLREEVGQSLASHDSFAKGTEFVIHNRKNISQLIHDETHSDDFKDRIKLSVGQALAPTNKISKGTTAKIEKRRAINRLSRVRAEAKTQIASINETLKSAVGDTRKQAEDAKKDLEKLLDQSYLKDNKHYNKLKTDRGRTNYVNRLADKLSDQVDTAVAERADLDIYMRKEALFEFSTQNSSAVSAFFWGSTREYWYHDDIPYDKRMEAVIEGLKGELDTWAKNNGAAADYIKQVGIDNLKENMTRQDVLEIMMRLLDIEYADFVNPDEFMERMYQEIIASSAVIIKGIHSQH